MGIQNWSENIVLVTLAEEPQMGEELRTVIEIVRDRGDCDVVIDFADVDIVTSSSIAKILKLRKALKDCRKTPRPVRRKKRHTRHLHGYRP